MKKAEEIKRLIKNESIKTNPEVDEAVFADLANKLEKACNENATSSGPNRWRILMQNKTTKLTAAAVLLMAAVVCFHLMPIPDAYALEDTIDAYNSIRWLHVLQFGLGNDEDPDSEIWLGCDEYGNIDQMRFKSRKDIGNPIGDLVIAGTSEYSEAWLPSFNLHIVGYGDPSVILMGFNSNQLDPKFLFENLNEQEKNGEAFVVVDTPREKSKPIVITVTYPSDSKSNKWKKIIYVDQGTKLVSKIEKFEHRNEQFVKIISLHFSNYNQPIDPIMFSLEGDVPDDAEVYDVSQAEVGLSQEDLTDKEITEEVTSQFFQALVDKDYDKAGLLCLGAPGFLVEQVMQPFKEANLLQVLSVGPGHRDPDPDSNGMNCSCKVLAEYQGGYYILNAWMTGAVRIGDEADRWMLCNLNISIEPADGKINLFPDQSNPKVVTYYGLEKNKFLQRWLVLGPLPYPCKDGVYFASEEGQQVAFDMDFIDPAGFDKTVKIYDKDYNWAMLESEYNHIDLRQLNEDTNDFEMAYLMAQIEMPEEKTITLGIGSDDGVKVWLNGELVHSNWAIRGVVTDNDLVSVTFKRGMNQLVLKIQNGMGPWGFCCRATEE